MQTNSIYNSNGANEGSSYKNAVIINEISDSLGVVKEYKWLGIHYPGYSFISQSLNMHEGKPYDIIKIKTADGVERLIYFDISKFYKKW